MSDIVKTLRDLADIYGEECRGFFLEAADEIERLRRDVELLRKGLEFEKRLNHERLEPGA